MNDLRDWFVIAYVAVFNTAGFYYIEQHPSDINYAVWAGLLVVSGSIYHYLIIKDDKSPDNKL